MGALQRLRSILGGRARDGVDARVDQVAPWLLIGPQLPVAHYRDLRERGVTHVVDLRAEGSDDPGAIETLGFRWRHLPVADRQAPTDEQLATLIAWFDHESDPDSDQTLYVHCRAGLGRTPTVAIALLMQRDLSLAEAHRLVSAARPESQPTTPQIEWLQSLEVRRVRDG